MLKLSHSSTKRLTAQLAPSSGLTQISAVIGARSAAAVPRPKSTPFDATYAHDSADRLAGETLEGWYPMLASIRQEFDDACGDTWCEGDFTNLQALRFRCSEDTNTGLLGGCSWTFAGSTQEIRSTGRLVLDHEGFACPVAVEGTAAEFVAALAPAEGDAGRVIDRALPGGTATLRDALNDCF